MIKFIFSIFLLFLTIFTIQAYASYEGVQATRFVVPYILVACVFAVGAFFIYAMIAISETILLTLCNLNAEEDLSKKPGQSYEGNSWEVPRQVSKGEFAIS